MPTELTPYAVLVWTVVGAAVGFGLALGAAIFAFVARVARWRPSPVEG